VKIAVVGAGSFGTVLCNTFAALHKDIYLWVFEEDVYQSIKNDRVNNVFMPGLILEKNIIPTMDMAEALKGADIVLLAAPSHVAGIVLGRMKPYLEKNAVLASVAKGIENKTNHVMAEVAAAVLGGDVMDNICVLSGPSFAKEVAEKKPTLVVAASKNLKNAEMVQKQFSSDFFRIYTSDDVIGVELGGAVKNVIAIAAGICDGMNLGYNGMAALITRGLAEMTRLGVAMGANPLTFKGLSGVGDLVLTCTGGLSRNRQVGLKLAQGQKIADIQKEMRMVAEGVRTSLSVYELSKKHSVEMPISELVYKIINEDKDPKIALKELMQRQLKFEREFIV
jgi:glycerol-3-phosphate dehydrogenase (NAD(P)+)